MAAESISEQQRSELHKTIWSIADDMRGSVDGWDFKQYVLGMLFYRFISENLVDYIAELEGGGVEYAAMEDSVAENARAALVDAKGFFIPRVSCSATLLLLLMSTTKTSMKF